MAVDEKSRRQQRLAAFRQEAADRLGRLNLAWINFETKGADPDGFLRESHTLKGEASLSGFSQVSHLVHLIEGFVKRWRDRKCRPDQQAGDLVLRGLDLVGGLVLAEPESASPEAATFVEEIRTLMSQGEDEGPAPPATAPVAAAKPAPARREASVRIASEKIDRLISAAASWCASCTTFAMRPWKTSKPAGWPWTTLWRTSGRRW
jgi:chemotaxis protein histidine kinase CheA